MRSSSRDQACADEGHLGNGGVLRAQELDILGVDLLSAAVDEGIDAALAGAAIWCGHAF